jgi:hypothetical protein
MLKKQSWLLMHTKEKPSALPAEDKLGAELQELIKTLAKKIKDLEARLKALERTMGECSRVG